MQVCLFRTNHLSLPQLLNMPQVQCFDATERNKTVDLPSSPLIPMLVCFILISLLFQSLSVTSCNFLFILILIYNAHLCIYLYSLKFSLHFLSVLLLMSLYHYRHDLFQDILKNEGIQGPCSIFTSQSTLGLFFSMWHFRVLVIVMLINLTAFQRSLINC